MSQSALSDVTNDPSCAAIVVIVSVASQHERVKATLAKSDHRGKKKKEKENGFSTFVSISVTLMSHVENSDVQI